MTGAAVDKFLGLTLAAAAPLAAMFSNDLTNPVVGVGLTTIAGAIFGTYAAIGYDETVRPRGRLFVLATSTVIIASALVGFVPRLMGWEWSSGGAEAALACAVAFGFYHLFPPALKRIGELIREFKLTDLLPWRKGAGAQEPGAPTAAPSSQSSESEK